MGSEVLQTGHGRVWMQTGGAAPDSTMAYKGLARLGAFTLPRGDITPVSGPSPFSYDEFRVIDEVKGAVALPTTSIIMRLGITNPLLTEQCPMHLQARYGKCENPRDPVGGWELILGYEQARITNVGGDQQTALEEADRAVVLLTGDVTARKMWVIHQLSLAETGEAEVLREVAAIIVSDYISCGDCGYRSDGEQRVLAVVNGSGTGSPGLAPELLFSVDGGSTWDEYDIDSLTGNEQPSDIAVVGTNIVVPSQGSISLHLSTLTDPDTWTEVTTGFVAGGAPNAIHSEDSANTWVVGQGGYIYKIENPANGVFSVQAAGAVFNDNLLDIHGIDARNLVAVGANGLIVKTTNGGSTWTEVTGPTVATINKIWMRTAYRWLIGDAVGRLYYTQDGGITWTENVFPMSGLGQVYDLGFCDHPDSPYGFMVASDGTHGYIFRSLDGGSSWYQLPDFEGSTPTNYALTCLAVGISGNYAIAGGVEASGAGADGILVVAK